MLAECNQLHVGGMSYKVFSLLWKNKASRMNLKNIVSYNFTNQTANYEDVVLIRLYSTDKYSESSFRSLDMGSFKYHTVQIN